MYAVGISASMNATFKSAVRLLMLAQETSSEAGLLLKSRNETASLAIIARGTSAIQL